MPPLELEPQPASAAVISSAASTWATWWRPSWGCGDGVMSLWGSVVGGSRSSEHASDEVDRDDQRDHAGGERDCRREQA